MTETHLAPAKINLWLRIFEPDTTGYHPLDTLFCALELADEITITAGDAGLALTVTGIDVGPTDRNLAYRAAEEFFRTTGLPPKAAIQLKKNIPAGAGLGGGSSDAATVLRALNEMHGSVLPAADIFAMAARLGSDVAFFLCGSSLAHATGRGELLQPLPPLDRKPVIVAVPDFAIATADAYRWLDEARAFSEKAETESRLPASWDDVEKETQNDLETVVFQQHPVLRELKQALISSGARIALLSGSGSTLFAVYDSDAARDGAAGTLAGTVRASGATLISTYSRVV